MGYSKDHNKENISKPQKDVGKTELKLPRSGCVHHAYITGFIVVQKPIFWGAPGRSPNHLESDRAVRAETS